MRGDHRRRLARTSFICGAASFVIGTAHAQQEEQEQGTGVRDRARPEYDASGIKAGAFRLYPSVVLSADYNDNIYAVATPRLDDVYLRAEPSLLLASGWSRHEFTAEVGGRVERYVDTENENNEEYYAKAGGRLDIGGATTIKASGYYGHLVDARSNNAFDDGNTALLTAEPISYDLAKAEAGFSHVINRLRLSGEASFQSYDFEDQPLIGGGVSDQDVRDRDVTQYKGQADWAISPDTSFFVRGAVNNWDYDLAPPEAPYDRDSNGYEIVGGANFKLGHLASGEVFVGYQEQNFDDDARLSTVSAVDYGAAIYWYLSQLTTVTVNVESDIKPSTVADASSFLRQDAQVTIDHELLRNVLLQARASYGRDEFDDITRTDEWVSGGVRADYLLNRNARVFAAIDYIDHASNVPINDYKQTVVSLGVKFQL